MATTTVKRHVVRPKAPGRNSTNDITPASWLAYLESQIRTDANGVRRVNGYQLNDTQSRNLYKWRQEGIVPTLWAIDRWLTSLEIHLNEFFDFCEHEGLEAWLHGEPAWHKEQPPDEEDA